MPAVGVEDVDPGVAVAVGHVQPAVGRGRRVGDHVERPGRPFDGVRPGHEPGVGGHAGRAERAQERAVGPEDAQRVVHVVGAVHGVVGADADPMRVGEDALAPGVEEAAVAVEDQHRVLAPAEGVDTVGGVGGDAGHLDERPAFGQLLPAPQDLEFDLVGPSAHRTTPHPVSRGPPIGATGRSGRYRVAPVLRACADRRPLLGSCGTAGQPLRGTAVPRQRLSAQPVRAARPRRSRCARRDRGCRAARPPPRPCPGLRGGRWPP